MKFPESKLAYHYLWPIIDRGGIGLEIGGSAHNSWGYKIMASLRNVDVTDDPTTVFKRAEVELCGSYLPVDIVAPADRLPLETSSVDFIVHSHVIEHVANPIRAHREWWRVLRPEGIVFAHVPHRDAHPPDRDRPITEIDHIIRDFLDNHDEETHPFGGPGEADVRGGHYHVFDTPLYLQMIDSLPFTQRSDDPQVGFDIVDVRARDEKVGNSFVVVLRAMK